MIEGAYPSSPFLSASHHLLEWISWPKVTRIDLSRETVELSKITSSVPGEALGDVPSALTDGDDLLAIRRPLEILNLTAKDGDVILHRATALGVSLRCPNLFKFTAIKVRTVEQEELLWRFSSLSLSYPLSLSSHFLSLKSFSPSHTPQRLRLQCIVRMERSARRQRSGYAGTPSHSRKDCRVSSSRRTCRWCRPNSSPLHFLTG